jgi:hypothetical protein
MEDVWIALITVGGGVLTAIVGGATLHAARDERRAQRRRDLEDAMAEFLAALTKAVARLTELPHLAPWHPLNIYADFSRRLSDKVFPGRSYIKAQRQMREVLGDHPLIDAERVVDTASRFRVIGVGPKLESVVDEALEYLITLGSDRSQEQLNRWPSIRERVVSAIEDEREVITTAKK